MCDERERLIGYVYDECDAGERGAIGAHLATCDDCRREIRDLRSVRQDLLAWSVPEHESVWRPLPVSVVAPFWRAMPAWAMSAAAGIILLAGAAGGATAYAFLPREAPASSVAAVPALQPVAATADWSAVDARVRAQVQNEVDRRMREVGLRLATSAAQSPAAQATVAAAANPAQLAREVTALRADQERLMDTVFSVYREQNQMKIRQNNNNLLLTSLVQEQSGPAGR